MTKPLLGAVCALTLAIAAPAAALTTDAPMVGDWDCGDGLRVYVTDLGSIETLGGEPSYRAGLIDVVDDVIAITWDDGGTTNVVWALDADTLALDGLTEAPLSCTPHN